MAAVCAALAGRCRGVVVIGVACRGLPRGSRRGVVRIRVARRLAGGTARVSGPVVRAGRGRRRALRIRAVRVALRRGGFRGAVGRGLGVVVIGVARRDRRDRDLLGAVARRGRRCRLVCGRGLLDRRHGDGGLGAHGRRRGGGRCGGRGRAAVGAHRGAVHELAFAVGADHVVFSVSSMPRPRRRPPRPPPSPLWFPSWISRPPSRPSRRRAPNTGRASGRSTGRSAARRGRPSRWRTIART